MCYEGATLKTATPNGVYRSESNHFDTQIGKDDPPKSKMIWKYQQTATKFN